MSLQPDKMIEKIIAIDRERRSLNRLEDFMTRSMVRKSDRFYRLHAPFRYLGIQRTYFLQAPSPDEVIEDSTFVRILFTDLRTCEVHVLNVQNDSSLKDSFNNQLYHF